MRQIRQTLRLHHEAGLSYSQIGRALGIPKATVGKTLLMARAAGVDWTTALTLTEDELEARLYKPPVPRSSRQLEPEFAAIHQELKRPGVTLMLLWEEHVEQHGQEQTHRYAQFCVHYREYAKSLKRTMRQIHRGGEKLFIDFAGTTVGLREGDRAHIFVAMSRSTRLHPPHFMLLKA